MKLKKLEKFQHIFQRDDFSYISSEHNIKKINETIRYHLNKPEKSDIIYIKFIESYLQNLQSFYFWLNGEKVPKIKDSFNESIELFSHILGIFKNLVPEKRIMISNSYINKYAKTLTYILNKLSMGLRDVFEHEHICETNINRDQIQRYLLDEDIGLGQRNIFKKTNSKFNIRDHILDMDKKELENSIKAIENREFYESVNGWTVWGKGRGANDIRIHLVAHNFKKPELYRIYRVNGEHQQHVSDLRSLKPA